jgi:hypothetical protein
MNREEILEKSRAENKNRDEREQATWARAGQISMAIGGLVCAMLILLDAIFANRTNCALWAVYLTITGTNQLIRGWKLKKTFCRIFGLIQIAAAVVFLVIYISALVR